MAQKERVGYEVAVERLHQFKHLSQVIDDRWLRRQLSKTVDQYSLIAGWLTTSESEWDWTYDKFTAALDAALAILDGNVSEAVENKLRSKIRAHSVRAETKGTLAEISLAVFLVQHNIPFAMETRLAATSKKDVDFSLQFDGLEPVHIEVQWISESDMSVRAANAGAPFRLGANFNYLREKIRILNKIYDKTLKFTHDDITLVALSLEDQMVSGTFPWGPIGEDLEQCLGNEIRGDLSENAAAIRELVDGVIWFELDFDRALSPKCRGYRLNEHSEHFGSASLMKWIELWSHQNEE